MLQGNSETDFLGGWNDSARVLVQDTEASSAFFPSEDRAQDFKRHKSPVFVNIILNKSV